VNERMAPQRAASVGVTSDARSSAPPPSARRFLAFFAGVALSFIGASAYSQLVQVSIDDAAVQITGNAAPSIEHLSKAHIALRSTQALLHQYVAAGTRDPERLDAIIRSHEQFHTEITAYLVLPAFPGEQTLWIEVSRDLRPVEDGVDQIVARLAAEDFPGAARLLNEELPVVVERAIRAISRSLDLDVNETRRLAQSIERTRSRAVIIEGALDCLAAVLSLIAGLVLFRTVRNYAALIEAHQRLLERRADELEQFAGRVAHDILSPLSTTGMALAIAGKSLPDNSKAKDAVTRGNRSLQRVQRIVSGLFEFARAGANPLPDACVEVGPILEDILGEIRLSAMETGIEVTVESFAPCSVACSPGILTSLLSNLLTNAVKYMGDRAERRVTVRVLDRQSAVRFEVADTGPGIPEHLREDIFEPYVRGLTSGQPGIGLGLATVKRITQTHGGNAGVRSAVGRGSVFWFDLPKPSVAAA
jgi:signal transduction histidine kinase